MDLLRDVIIVKTRSPEKSQKNYSGVYQAELDKEFQRLFFSPKADWQVGRVLWTIPGYGD